MPPSKKSRPSFAVAHDPLDARPGWVYRSDAPAVGAAPAPIPTPPPASGPASPARAAARFEPAKPEAAPTRGWIASSLYLMALPLAVGMTLMLAPVAWALRARARE